MRRVQVNTAKGYEVKIGAGLLAAVGQEAAALTAGKVFVVTDENVAPCYLARVCSALREAGLQVFSLALPAGEQSKSPKYYVNLLNVLAEKQLSRSDLLVALGGGVIGDLTGFAAATYLRGISYIQIPTTLLAMVDSSVGGKTGINLPEGKNLAGAFYQPSLVLCDTDCLNTLPEKVFRDGCAEVIKTAILFDRELFAHLKERGGAFDREYVIASCVAHKRDVVCRDEFERGERQLLNLGHTVGHAIEKESGYLISHGVAVAVGLAVMARAYCKDRAEILALLQKFALPVSTEFSPKTLANAAIFDKKRRGDTLTLAIPHAIGECSLEEVSLSQLERVIAAGC